MQICEYMCGLCLLHGVLYVELMLCYIEKLMSPSVCTINIPSKRHLLVRVSKTLHFNLTYLFIYWIIMKFHFASHIKIYTSCISYHTIIVNSYRGWPNIISRNSELFSLQIKNNNVRNPGSFGQVW